MIHTHTHTAQVTTPFPGLPLTVDGPPLCDTTSKSTKASLITDCAYVCKHVYNIKLAIIMGLYKHTCVSESVTLYDSIQQKLVKQELDFWTLET